MEQSRHNQELEIARVNTFKTVGLTAIAIGASLSLIALVGALFVVFSV